MMFLEILFLEEGEEKLAVPFGAAEPPEFGIQSAPNAEGGLFGGVVIRGKRSDKCEGGSRAFDTFPVFDHLGGKRIIIRLGDLDGKLGSARLGFRGKKLFPERIRSADFQGSRSGTVSDLQRKPRFKIPDGAGKIKNFSPIFFFDPRTRFRSADCQDRCCRDLHRVLHASRTSGSPPLSRASCREAARARIQKF